MHRLHWIGVAIIAGTAVCTFVPALFIAAKAPQYLDTYLVTATAGFLGSLIAVWMFWSIGIPELLRRRMEEHHADRPKE